MEHLVRGLNDKMPCSKCNPCEKCGEGQMWSEQYVYDAQNKPPIPYKCDKCGYEKLYDNDDDPDNPTWGFDTEEEIQRILSHEDPIDIYAEPTIIGLTYTIQEMDKEFGDDAIPFIIKLLECSMIHCRFWAKSITTKEYENYMSGLNNLYNAFQSKLNKD